jgi:hypothetical protein
LRDLKAEDKADKKETFEVVGVSQPQQHRTSLAA